MKNSTIGWIVVILIIVGGLAWWAMSMNGTPQVGGAPAATSTQQGTATTSDNTNAVPGDNLTLGQDSDATLGNYLIAYNGMTLYTYSPDTTNKSNCSGQCAVNWPPYTVTSTNNLVAESPIGGTIGTLVRADGSTQVTYNGRPLYFYIKDKSPGDTTGQGVGGVWYVVKP